MPVGPIIAAIFLPPLGVFLDEGVSTNFWIDVALTCLGFIPGVIFALYAIITGHRRTAAASAQ